YAQQGTLGRVGGLADRLRHLARLAVAEAHPALLVADDDQRGKAEAPAALHHLRHAIAMHELVDKFAVALFPLALPSHACHGDSVSFAASRPRAPRRSGRPRAPPRPAP